MASGVEKENTLRALAGHRLLVSSSLCRFGWHRWTTWCEPIDHSIYKLQHRECIHCKIVTEKRVAQNMSI